MKKQLLFLCLTGIAIGAAAQNAQPAESGTFLIHKFEQHIGKETFKVENTANVTTYKVDFKFVDRGSPVPLKAELAIMKNLDPVRLIIKGNVARSAVINDSVSFINGQSISTVDGVTTKQKIAPNSFPVASYAPGTFQQVLLQYWQHNKQPETITTLPNGSVQIKKDGEDVLTFKGKPLTLERYTISGLIWGNELLWTDDAGNLICLITNDAEADKLEMMREPYEELLPELISRAAGYSMRLFANAIPPAGAGARVIAVKGGTVIDVVNEKNIPNAVVIIENGIIKKVGTSTEVAIPKNAQVIDATGKTILPGLWDMHAHFEQAEWGPAYLAVGVTTVRDCGNEFGYINAIKKAIDDGKGVGPLILKAGIIDGKGPYALGIIQADTKEEAVKAVDRYKENGFVQIKIYDSVKPAIVKAICDEAHRLGLTVTGHIPEGMNLKQGVDSGMDMVNHSLYVYSIMKRNKDRSINFEDSTSVAAIKFIKDHNVVIDPTIGVFELIFRSLKENILIVEPAFATFPLPLKSMLSITGRDSASAAKVRPIYNSMVKIVKVLSDAGVTIVAGTDQGFPGYSLDRELEIYVQAGLTPMQAIKTATIIPANVMNMGKQSGSIEAGKQADLVIIDGDPLNNIRQIRNVTTVIKAEQVYDPVKMHQLVGFSK